MLRTVLCVARFPTILFQTNVHQLRLITRPSTPPVLSDARHLAPPFTDITPLSAGDVDTIRSASAAKASTADCIPSSIIHAASHHLLSELVQCSFCQGTLPSSFKHVSVVPRLKKPSLDKHALLATGLFPTWT